MSPTRLTGPDCLDILCFTVLPLVPIGLRPALNRLPPFLPTPIILLLWVIMLTAHAAAASNISHSSAIPRPLHALLQDHCVSCHDGEMKKGGLDLEQILATNFSEHAAAWEAILRKLQTRQMPPAGKKRPSEREYERVVGSLTRQLDQTALKNPLPGTPQALRRLSRAEYRNAIRDLLALEIDAAALLPKDDASHGFDHVGVTSLSPTLLNRYLSAAEKISRLALGTSQRAPGGETYRNPPDLTQEEQLEGLPPGTRGGMLIKHVFPQEGDYEIQVRLTRDRNEHVEGMRESHELEILIDRGRAALFTISPPRDNNHDAIDAHLKARIRVPAGPHSVGVTFLKNPSSLLETKRQPYQARYNMHRHPRLGPAVYQVSINGPYQPSGPGSTPSRERILGSLRPGSALDEAAAATIIGSLARRAYRRPATDSDLARLMVFHREGQKDGGFDAGIQAALSAILVSPEFLFRIERPSAGNRLTGQQGLDDFALASRLAFFLWSSIPDESLLAAAERGELGRGSGLERQTRRMLADPRAMNLVHNFGDQWLQLRNLESITPDLRLFPDFDDNLRQAFRRETELHLESMLREDRSLLDLLRRNETYLNERLARHYGIPNVVGSEFRPVKLEPGSQRGGLLRQGSVLTVTSYATRTSPVLRGKWILENILGTPPPPPPGNVPALKEKTISNALPVRERLAEHRANIACAGCHNLMDPPGFALENFDAIGRWRTLEDGHPVNAEGGLPDGSQFSGVSGLEQGLLERPELFAMAFTEKLLTFALGRGLEPSDAPAVRAIVREAASDRYRFSTIVTGITRSPPFTLRKNP